MRDSLDYFHNIIAAVIRSIPIIFIANPALIISFTFIPDFTVGIKKASL